MGTTITDDTITSDLTSHSARLFSTGWGVTYLDGAWTRDQAISAITVAELVDKGASADDLLLTVLAEELGLTAADAIDLIRQEGQE